MHGKYSQNTGIIENQKRVTNRILTCGVILWPELGAEYSREKGESGHLVPSVV